MEKYAAALTAFGGMTAIGGLIDLLLYRDRKRVESWMIDWWIRFDDVGFRNFGQKEAARFIEVQDAIVGSRFWSRSRLRALSGILLSALLLSLVWITIEGVVRNSGYTFESIKDYWAYWSWPHASEWVAATTSILVTTLLFSVSLYLTRSVALFVSRVALSAVSGIALFSVSIVLQCLIVVYWNRVLLPFVLDFIGESIANLTAGHFFGYTNDLIELIADYLMHPVSTIETGWLFLLSFESPLISAGHDLARMYKALLDLFATGLRIGFAMAFLGSYLFTALFKPMTGRLWEGLIESKKPLFTSVFGGIGAIGGAVYAFMK